MRVFFVPKFLGTKRDANLTVTIECTGYPGSLSMLMSHTCLSLNHETTITSISFTVDYDTVSTLSKRGSAQSADSIINNKNLLL